jgi:cardiolipin synthase A/B
MRRSDSKRGAAVAAWPTQWISWHTVAVVLGLLLYVSATQGLQQRRPPSAAIAWVLLIALVPYVGLPLFLLFGSRKVGRNARAPLDGPSEHAAPGTDSWFALARALNLPPAASQRGFRLHTDGALALRALLDVIDRAQRTLEISTYLIGDDAVGCAVLERVRARVAAGVAVRLMVDGVGGLRSLRIVHRFRHTGAVVAWFVSPLHWPLRGRTNLRNHRKLAIADRAVVWSGGRNLAAEYFEGDGKSAPWIDLTFDVEGPLAATLGDIFEADWAFATGTARAQPPPPPAIGVPAGVPAGQPFPGVAQPVPSGPDFAEDTLYSLLLVGCYRAQRRIDIATPYFVPDDSLLRALSLASRRGVKVRLLMPARSNHHLADLARGRPLQQMASNGIEVRMLPVMMHAKLVAFDDEWLLLGSANFDARSLFLNYELMVALPDSAALQAGSDWFEATAAAASPWHPPRRTFARDLREGLLLWLAFQL